MRIVHLSYSQVRPTYTNPDAWLNNISHSTGVMESMAQYAEVIAIYHLSHKGVVVQKGVEYHFTNLTQWRLLLPVKFNRFVSNLKPDVIIIHGLNRPWQVMLLYKQLRNKPLIIVQHHAERPFADFRKWISRKIDKSIAAYLFSSIEQGMLWVKEKQILDPSKIKVVMGTSSPFCPISKPEALSKTHVNGKLNYLWVADLTQNKDPFLAVDAFIEFRKGRPDAQLWMIYGWGLVEAEINQIIAMNNAGHFIHLVGKVNHDQLLFWYNSVDFFISCSHYEGSGIALCEAMSCGCIPIVTSIPSFKMMTGNGMVGLLFEPDNKNQLLSCLKASVSIPIRAEKEKVKKQFERELSCQANALKIKGVIDSLL